MERCYDDIISLSRPPSPGHPPMAMIDRAAQFSPFAALTGYEDAIEEAGRLTDKKIELGEQEQAELNQKLQALQQRVRERPLVHITCFRRDEKKAGGAYVTVSGRLKRISEGKLHLDRHTAILLEDVLDVAADGLLK